MSSFTPTQLSHLTTPELLHLLDYKRPLSPIIGELCKRLEKADEDEGMNHRVECPVCQSALEVEPDYGNSVYHIKVDRA